MSEDISQSRLSSLVVDGTSLYGPKAYISESGPGKLIVFDLRSRQWWEVSVSQPQKLTRQPLSTAQLALTGSYLFLASNMTDTLFRMDLTALRTMRTTHSPTTAHNNVGKSFSISIAEWFVEKVAFYS